MMIPDEWRSEPRGPVYAVAPMVGCCDVGFRMLCRRFGATVVYTEMLLADTFASSSSYRIQALGEGGVREDDHPLIVQFAANVPDDFLAAALQAQRMGADGVDVNFGCPQRRARDGNYGAWMTDDWDLCCGIVRGAAACAALTIPVCVKIRLQERTEEFTAAQRTEQFACRLAEAGASMIVVHGRMRGSEDRRRDGAADLEAIRGVVAAIRASYEEKDGPLVITNGNVREVGDVGKNLDRTGADGIMVAEYLLQYPTLFEEARLAARGAWGGTRIRSVMEVIEEYFRLLETLSLSSSNPLRLEDGSVHGKNGNMIRYDVSPSSSQEFERLSVWWTNAEVVQSHIRNVLADCGRLSSRSSFKKAKDVQALVEGVRQSFGIKAR